MSKKAILSLVFKKYKLFTYYGGLVPPTYTLSWLCKVTPSRSNYEIEGYFKDQRATHESRDKKSDPRVGPLIQGLPQESEGYPRDIWFTPENWGQHQRFKGYPRGLKGCHRDPKALPETQGSWKRGLNQLTKIDLICCKIIEKIPLAQTGVLAHGSGHA